MEREIERDWGKSSYSGANGGDCVETASGKGIVWVRDTKQKHRTDRTMLPVSAGAWTTFTESIKAS